MPRDFPSPLPIASTVLRGLIVLNWLYAAFLLTILVGMFAAQSWMAAALGIADAADAHLVVGIRAIAALGLVTVPLHFAVLSRLLAMVQTVRSRDPFVAANAQRLKSIAWAILALQLLSVIIALIADVVSTPAHPLYLDAGFSTGGWLSVLLTFVLARVFAQGALMREDLEGTV